MFENVQLFRQIGELACIIILSVHCAVHLLSISYTLYSLVPCHVTRKFGQTLALARLSNVVLMLGQRRRQ